LEANAARFDPPGCDLCVRALDNSPEVGHLVSHEARSWGEGHGVREGGKGGGREGDLLGHGACVGGAEGEGDLDGLASKERTVGPGSVAAGEVHLDGDVPLKGLAAVGRGSLSKVQGDHLKAVLGVRSTAADGGDDFRSYVESAVCVYLPVGRDDCGIGQLEGRLNACGGFDDPLLWCGIGIENTAKLK